jgi:ribulose-5-phosphate 4-epimerase/fuculose-1-phosphate aldolase
MSAQDSFVPASMPKFDDPAAEQLHRKQRLAIAFRVLGDLGYDEGVAGHFTVRDTIEPDTFWVNPLGQDFSMVRVRDLIRVDHTGRVVEGRAPVNAAAFAIHSQIHAARPDIIAAVHTHSLHGKAFSILGQKLLPLTQDACAFYEDHGLFDDYTGVVLDLEEGQRIAAALGTGKAVILRNHGLLTVGKTVESAMWWFTAMDRSCHAQLLAMAAGKVVEISPENARTTSEQVGNEYGGWFSGQPLFERTLRRHPDCLD